MVIIIMVIYTFSFFLVVKFFFLYFHGNCSISWGVWVFDNTTPPGYYLNHSHAKYCIILSKVFVVHCEAHAVFEYDSYVFDDYSKPVKGGVMCWHTYNIIYIYVLGDIRGCRQHSLFMLQCLVRARRPSRADINIFPVPTSITLYLYCAFTIT